MRASDALRGKKKRDRKTCVGATVPACRRRRVPTCQQLHDVAHAKSSDRQRCLLEPPQHREAGGAAARRGEAGRARDRREGGRGPGGRGRGGGPALGPPGEGRPDRDRLDASSPRGNKPRSRGTRAERSEGETISTNQEITRSTWQTAASGPPRRPANDGKEGDKKSLVRRALRWVTATEQRLAQTSFGREATKQVARRTSRGSATSRRASRSRSSPT